MDFDPGIPEHAELLELRASNNRRIVELAQRGLAVNPNRDSQVLGFLLDQLVGDEERLAFERSEAQRIAADLDNIDTQVRQAELMQGVAGVDPSQLNRAQRRQAARANNGH